MKTGRTTLRRRLGTLAGLLAMTAATVVAVPGQASAEGAAAPNPTGAVNRDIADVAADTAGIDLSGMERVKVQTANQAVYGYIYRNVQTNKCLDHSNRYGVRAIRCNSGLYQVWIPLKASNPNRVVLKNYQTKKCLDHSNRYGLRAIRCNGGTYQEWIDSDFTVYPDTGRLINAKTRKCLDHSNRYGIRAINCNGGRYQLWST
ncbi:RICIN domain-containing protein [Phytoactinopolyspora halotolerans]|uniref:Ricin-type beta-trefoil lectin domain protein n=1 Tax=Phytoactinopolyspora halotolerans TaxID=1981512 RepID=A0A6L9S7S9_9ACTN|nr:ricin-type beta-trefoil lectin domain protein [Phytoactinopolyspora halotolerans]NEE01226.1 ricin-type beta-trefoil lectin domain protein [Phytoactinopolyspora halotolerans]